MTDRDVEREDEANRQRAEGGDGDGDTVPGGSVGAVVGSLLRPTGVESADEGNAEERREENDAEQRPA